MTDTLAIMGTCVSEDWIHYRDLAAEFRFALPPLRQHSSLLSLFSKPAAVPEGLFGSMSGWEQAQLRSEFDKSFLRQLMKARPRVLLLDFALDAFSGVIGHGEGYITRSYLVRRSPLFAELKTGGLLTPQSNGPLYLREFSAAAQVLQRFVARNLPDCQVVLHKTRFVEAGIDKAGVVRTIGGETERLFKAANEVLPALEEAFQRHVTCDVVSLLDETWHADASHMWGIGGMHLERRYYTRFNAELARVVARADGAGAGGNAP